MTCLVSAQFQKSPYVGPLSIKYWAGYLDNPQLFVVILSHANVILLVWSPENHQNPLVDHKSTWNSDFDWLVVWCGLEHFLLSHILGFDYHPNWRTHIFQRGGPGPPTSWGISGSTVSHSRGIISALRSMYRFNGSDGRLRRTCETASGRLRGLGLLEKIWKNETYKN